DPHAKSFGLRELPVISRIEDRRMRLLSILSILLVGMATHFDGRCPGIANADSGSIDLSTVTPTKGPLTISGSNPRYFADGSGKVVYLTGSHIWNNFQDRSAVPFDYLAYLNFLGHYNHNFIRLWVTEETRHRNGTEIITPVLYKRTGPGKALD